MKLRKRMKKRKPRMKVANDKGTFYVARRNIRHHYRVLVYDERMRIVQNLAWSPARGITTSGVAETLKGRKEKVYRPVKTVFKYEIFVKAIVTAKKRKTSPEWVYEIRLLTWSEDALNEVQIKSIWLEAKRVIKDLWKLDMNMNWRNATDYQVGVESSFIGKDEIRAVAKYPEVSWVLHFWNGSGGGTQGRFNCQG